MLNANGRKNYTASGDAQAEALIDSVLAEMADTLKPTGLSIYLGGSYGRGEGGVRQDSVNGLLYNDLDFFVFARHVNDNARKLLHEISEKYEVRLKVDVDFSRPAGISEIKRNQKRLMMQELKRGCRLVCGEDLLAEYLPELPADQLPFSEACRLLLNRGMGLRFAQEKVSANSDETDFILRNINKAVLGTADAGLIVQGKYRWRIAERLAEIQNSALPDQWKKLYADAVEFKCSPHRNIPEDLPGLLQNVQDFFQAGVLAVSGADSVENIRRGLWEQCRKAGELNGLNYIRYCVKTRKLHSDITFLKMPPVAVVLSKLCTKNTDSDELYNEWLKFN